MKNTLYILPLAALLAACGGKKKEEAHVELKSDKQRASYGIGVNEAELLMSRMKQSGVDTAFDKAAILAGMKDYFDQKVKLTPEELRTATERYFDQLQQGQVAAVTKQFEAKKQQEEAYLVDNAKKPGVITTPSGLQYEVVAKGNGALIQLGDSLRVAYTGKYINGETFDSSEGREPYPFRLTPTGSVIEGWVEALQLMRKGSKFKLTVPWGLAYGDMGAPPRGEGDPGIPPYSVMVFDLEVVTHVPKK